MGSDGSGRRLVLRPPGHGGGYYVDAPKGFPIEVPARLVWHSDGSYTFVELPELDPWWIRVTPKEQEECRSVPYVGGQRVVCHVALNTFWLGTIEADPEGKNYVGSDQARVILDGNPKSENGFKVGMRRLSLLEILAWESA